MPAGGNPNAKSTINARNNMISYIIANLYKLISNATKKGRNKPLKKFKERYKETKEILTNKGHPGTTKIKNKLKRVKDRTKINEFSDRMIKKLEQQEGKTIQQLLKTQTEGQIGDAMTRIAYEELPNNSSYLNNTFPDIFQQSAPSAQTDDIEEKQERDSKEETGTPISILNTTELGVPMTAEEREHASQKIKTQRKIARVKAKGRREEKQEATRRTRELFDNDPNLDRTIQELLEAFGDTKITNDYKELKDQIELLEIPISQRQEGFRTPGSQREQTREIERESKLSGLRDLLKRLPDLPEIDVSKKNMKKIIEVLESATGDTRARAFIPLIRTMLDGKARNPAQIAGALTGVGLMYSSGNPLLAGTGSMIITGLLTHGAPPIQRMIGKFYNIFQPIEKSEYDKAYEKALREEQEKQEKDTKRIKITTKRKPPPLTEEQKKSVEEKKARRGVIQQRPLTDKQKELIELRKARNRYGPPAGPPAGPPPPDGGDDGGDDEPDDIKDFYNRIPRKELLGLIPLGAVVGGLIKSYKNKEGIKRAIERMPIDLLESPQTGLLSREAIYNVMLLLGYSKEELGTVGGSKLLNLLTGLTVGGLHYILDNNIIDKEKYYKGADEFEEVGKHILETIKEVHKQVEEPTKPKKDFYTRKLPSLIPKSEKPKENEIRQELNQHLISFEDLMKRGQKERAVLNLKNNIEKVITENKNNLTNATLEKIADEVAQQVDIIHNANIETDIPDDEEQKGFLSNIANKALGMIGGIFGENEDEDITEQPIERERYIPQTRGGIKKAVSRNDIIDSTQAILNQDIQLDRKGKDNMKWQPKAIIPSVDIFTESRHERYIDAVEFAQFNYVPKGSEGGYGTPSTNPLKMSQKLSDELRYNGGGITIPINYYNKLLEVSKINDKELKRLYLPEELPPMKFIPQDNDDTFENVNTRFYVNNENTAIGMNDPYRFFSNVDDYWTTTPDSVLFTINP